MQAAERAEKHAKTEMPPQAEQGRHRGEVKRGLADQKKQIADCQKPLSPSGAWPVSPAQL